MLLNIADLDALLTRRTRRASILCFADVDALAALCILRDYFKTIHLCYGFSLLVFSSQLAAEVAELSKTLSAPGPDGSGDLLILLNVGAGADISEMTRTRVLLVDYHRPTHINNVFSDTVYVLDDGVVSGSLRACFQKNAASRMVQGSLQRADPETKRLAGGEPRGPGWGAAGSPRPRRRRRRHRRRRGSGGPGDRGGEEGEGGPDGSGGPGASGEPAGPMNRGLFSSDSEDDIMSLSAMNLSAAGEGRGEAGTPGSRADSGAGSEAHSAADSAPGSAAGSAAASPVRGPGGRGSDALPPVVSEPGSSRSSSPAASRGSPRASRAAPEPSGETLGSEDSTPGQSSEYYYSDDYSGTSLSGRGSSRGRGGEGEGSAPEAPSDDQYTYEEYYAEVSESAPEAEARRGPGNLREALEFSDSEGERQRQALREQMLRGNAGLLRDPEFGGPGFGGPGDLGAGADSDNAAPGRDSPASSGTDLDVSANLLSDHEDDTPLRELSFVVSGGREGGGESSADASEGAGHRQVARLLAERDEAARHAAPRPGTQAEAPRARVRVKRRRRVRRRTRWGEDGLGTKRERGASGRTQRAGTHHRSGGGFPEEPDFAIDELQDEEDARILKHLRKYAPSTEALDETVRLRALQATLSPAEVVSLRDGLGALMASGDPASVRRAEASVRRYADVICQSQPSAALLARYVLSFSSSIQPDNLYLQEKVCWQGFLGVAWAVGAQIARCETFTSFWREYRYVIRSRPVRLRDDASMSESGPLSVADSFTRSETQTPLGFPMRQSGASSVPLMVSPSIGGPDALPGAPRDASFRARSASPRADGEGGFRQLGRIPPGSALADAYNPRLFSPQPSLSPFPGSMQSGRAGAYPTFRGADGTRVETTLGPYDRSSPDGGRGVQILAVARPRPYFVEIDPALFLFRLSSFSDCLRFSSFSVVAALYRVHSRSAREPRTMLRSTLASTVITHMGIPNTLAQRSYTDLPKRRRDALIARYLTLVARAGAGRYSLATVPNVVIESSNERFELSVFDHAALVEALLCAITSRAHKAQLSSDGADGPEDVEGARQNEGLRELLLLAGSSPEELLLMLSPDAVGPGRGVFAKALACAVEQQRTVVASEEKLRGKFQTQKAVPLLYSSTLDMPDVFFASSLSLVPRILADCRSSLAGMKRLSLEYKYVSVEAEEVQGRALRSHVSALPDATQGAPRTIFTDLLGSAASLPLFSKRTLPRERAFEEIRGSLSTLLTIKGGETGALAAQSTRAGLVEGLFGNAIPCLRETIQSLDERRRVAVLEELCPEEVVVSRGECGALGTLVRDKLSEKAHPAGWLGS